MKKIKWFRDKHIKAVKHITNRGRVLARTQIEAVSDWFIDEVGRAEAGRRGFFPIFRKFHSDTTVCFVWYLVPFALIVLIMKEFINGLYICTRSFLDDWRRYNHNLKKAEDHINYRK